MQHEQRGPGRPRKEEVTRQDEVKRRRQKRTGQGYLYGKRMGCNPELLDHNRFRYRWINDEQGARLLQKTQHDDWDIVPNSGGEMKEDASDLGDAVSIVVGTHPDGSPKRAYLCRKPKQWYEEDQAEKQAELDEQLEQLRRGNDRAGANQSDYVPHSGISM